jgi:hypothetical protein
MQHFIVSQQERSISETVKMTALTAQRWRVSGLAPLPSPLTSGTRLRVPMNAGADDELSQGKIKWMLWVSAVKALIAVAPAGDQMSSLQLGQFVLHGLEREMTQARKLPHIQFLPRVGKQKPENLRSDEREQLVQECFGHEDGIVPRPL